MIALRLLAVVLTVCVMTGCIQAYDQAGKPDKAKLLVGKWEVIAAKEELPVGSVIEFSKDGKMKITAKKGGKEESLNAIYKVDSDTIQFTLKLSDKDEQKDPLAIKTISERDLVLEAKGGITFEFKRVK